MGLITTLTDKNNKITKEILDTDLNKSTTGHVVQGHGQAADFDAAGLYRHIEGLSQNQCLCTGVVASRALDKYRISPKGEIQRTLQHFSYPAGLPGWLILDFDFSGGKYIEPDDAVKLLGKYDPALTTCSKVLSYSSSSFLYGSDGEKLNNYDNYHIYIEIDDGIDIERYGMMLFNRLILDGYGTIKVVKNSGALRLGTLIDKTVFSSGANREIFEASPICCEGVVSKRKGEGGFEDGDAVKWSSNMEISPEDSVRLELTVSELKADSGVIRESESQRNRGRIKRLKNKKVLKTGKSLINYDDWTDSSGTTHSALGLSEVIKCNKGNDLRLLDVVSTIGQWIDKGIPDPIDPFIRGIPGSKVGKDIARIRHDDDTGRCYLFSFYGSVEYDLVWDYDSVSSLIDKSGTIDELDQALEDIFDPASGIKWILTDSEVNDLAIEAAEKSKEFGGSGKKSVIGTDVRKAPKKFKDLMEKGATVRAGGNGVSHGDLPKHIPKMNSKMGLGMVGGKTRVLQEEFRPGLGEWVTTYTSIRELKDFHANKKVSVLKGGNYVEVAQMEHWHEHSARNTYDRVVFEPNATTFRGCNGAVPVIKQGGEYNQWMGFLANLKNAKSCEKILWHIEHIWCGGNKEIYEYTLAWLAELFQRPDSVGQMFLVLKSEQGAGKNIIIDQVIGKLLGVHAITTGEKEDLIGRFNSHLGLNVFMFLDEAVFAGDPRSKNLMKSLINESRVIEMKGVDKIKGRNLSKVMMATNDQYAANIDSHDRRHVYLPVSDSKTGDFKYFKELAMEIEDGGREAFLKFMLEHKIEVDVRKMPKGQSSQREDDMRRSADPAVKFFYSLVEDGPEQFDVEGGRSYSETEFANWHSETIYIPKHVLFEMFRRYCRSASIKVVHVDIQAFFRSLGAGGLYASRKKNKAVRDLMPMSEYGRDFLIKVAARPQCEARV